MTIAEPRLLKAPEILGRARGLALLHYGVVDGPHGLSLVVEVVDEDNTGTLLDQPWQEPGLRDAPIQVTAGRPGEPVTTPKVMIRDSGRTYQRLVVTFGRYGSPSWIDPAGAQITVVVRPCGISAIIDLD